MTWQDISSAPKDGNTQILIGRWRDFGFPPYGWDWIASAVLDKDGARVCIVDDEYREADFATHWMPLPPPPETSNG